MATSRILLLSLVLAACAGSHGDDSNTAGTSSNSAGNATTAGTGSAGRGAAGNVSQACKRTPAKHRAMPEMCDRERRPSAAEPSQPALGCTSDAECTQGQNGRCGPNNRGYRTCNYDQCFADDGCMEGGPCICGIDPQANNRCFMGNCRTDADCGDAGYCSPSFGTCGSYSGVVGYYCHTCKDECVDDGDCANGGYCAYEPTVGHWKCSTSQCVG